MRVVFVPWIKTYQWYLSGWEKDLKKAFPGLEIVIMKDFYVHIQYQKMETIIQRGVDIFSDGVPTIIIAHSFWGILAKAMIKRASDQAHIIGLITMASPHTMKYGWVSQAQQKLAIPSEVSVPNIHTYGWYLDPVVPYIYTQLENSHHTNYWGEHMAFLFSKHIRKHVIQAITYL